MGLTLLRLSAQEGPRIDPRHVSYDSLRFFGQMPLTGCKPGLGNLTGDIHPLGNLSPDGPPAWILDRVRCDTSTQPRDLLLYRGIPNSLPTVESGQRIGPSQTNTSVVYLASGDFDNSGFKDIVTSIVLLGDTIPGGFGVASVVVFWADDTGGYSIHDTTRLSCGTDAWAIPGLSVGGDITGDRIDDLFIITPNVGISLDQGVFVKIPRVLIYQGNLKEERWGSGANDREADASWWNRPAASMITIEDHDCDGENDMVFYQNVRGGTGSIHVLYGSAEVEFPDTNKIQSVTFTAASGEYSLLSDVTGDRVPELLVSAPSVDLIRAYAGKPGQRIIEQYGNGTDSLDRLNARYPLRPWAEIWLPNKLHEGWFNSGPLLSDLGDVTGDSADEIWSGSSPFLIGYVSKLRLDSMIDVLFRLEGSADVVRLGDIDSSNVPTIAVAYHNGIILYVKPGRIPSSGRYRQLPHDLNLKCGLTSDVFQGPGETQTLLHLEVRPNPADDHVYITWNPILEANEGELIIHDIMGREIYRSVVNSKAGRALWDPDGAISGIYYITIKIHSDSETKEIVLR